MTEFNVYHALTSVGLLIRIVLTCLHHLEDVCHISCFHFIASQALLVFSSSWRFQSKYRATKKLDNLKIEKDLKGVSFVAALELI